MTDWLRDSWAYLVAGGAVIASVVAVLRSTYAAERDRRALGQVELEKEKLALEVARLKNNPATVEDRRKIYDRIRAVLGEITRDAKVETKHIGELHEAWHDAAFRFPPEIGTAIESLIESVVALHVSGRVMERGAQRMSDEEWGQVIEENHRALVAIVDFERGLIIRFKPHLSL